jgi:hypothetical protein
MAKADKAAVKEETESIVKPADTAAPLAISGDDYDYGEDAGKGFEGQTKYKVAFFATLQSNSPQVENQNPAGAKKGDIFNTITKELIEGSEGLVFVPVDIEYTYVEWIPRDKGGGFVGKHSPTSPEVVDSIENHRATTGLRFPDKAHPLKRLGTDNDLQETYYLYVLQLTPDGKQVKGFGIIGFASSKISPYQDWISALRQFVLMIPQADGTNKPVRPALFSHRVVMQTWEDRQKVTGKPFMNVRFTPLAKNVTESLLKLRDQADRAIFDAAKEYALQLKSGEAKADFENQGGGPAVDDAGEPGGKAAF